MNEKPLAELDSILSRAYRLADERDERANTSHFLLALLAEGETSTAGRLLNSLNLKEGHLRAAMRVVGDERVGLLKRVAQEAQTLAHKATGRRKVRGGGLHVLLALSREPDSAASRCLVHLGHDSAAIGHAALGCLTGGGQKALASAARLSPPASRERRRRGPAATAGQPIVLSQKARHGMKAGVASPSSAAGQGSSPAPARRPTPATPTSSAPKRGTSTVGLTNPARGTSPSSLAGAQKGRQGSGGRATGKGRRGVGTSKGDGSRAQPLPRTSARPTALGTNKPRSSKVGWGGAGQLAEEQGEGRLLAQLARDLTAAAHQGELDPIVGRTAELNRIVDVLNRRRGNVPCLVGESGVGKTALVEGLAFQLAQGTLEGLPRRRLLQVHVGDLLAGTGVRGALAERLTALRKEVAALDGEVVLFLDDVHALLAATGAGEGAQELRAAMASGDFPCIVTTSPEGYRRYIEPDQALERRMTRVEIDEPSLEDTRHIMASGVGHYREHHGVDFADDALEAALQLSQRYLTDRRQPDKVFGVLDLAGSRAQRRKVSEVSRATVAEVVADLSGVPLERLAATDAERLLGLEELLGRRVIGHHHNLAQIAGALRRNAAGLGGERPVGSFLLLGPTGVGKTETARALAEVLFPGGGGMSRFDMSELSESHSVARLVGAPPGYVGYEAGGHLTEALRARPYQVVLLDEIEKAHPKVHMLLLQILEEGRLTDGRGRTVDFRHAVIIMTSNLGVSAVGAAKPIGFAAQKDATPTAGTATVEAARASVPPELWNRFDEVLYYAALSAEEVAEVARLMLQATAQRLEREKGILLDFDPSVVELLLNCGGYDPTLGARPMRRAVQRLVEAPLAEAVLRGEAGPQDRWRLVVRQGRVEAVVAGEASS